MAKEYEIMLVLSVKDGEDASKELLKKITDRIEKNGTLGEVDEWGRRKLAYLIDDEAEGYYAVVNFSAEPDYPVELERRLEITEGVLRYLNIAK